MQAIYPFNVLTLNLLEGEKELDAVLTVFILYCEVFCRVMVSHPFGIVVFFHFVNYDQYFKFPKALNVL